MSRNVKLGIFALLALGIFGYLTYKAGTFDWGQETYPLEIVFDSVSGLSKGAPVRMAGVTIGVVEDIELARNDEGVPKAIVTAKIQKGADIGEDATARIQQVGFLGDSVLEIAATPGKPLPKDTKSNERPPQITGTPAFEIQQIVEEVREGIDSIRPLIESANAVLGSATNQESIEDILASLNRFTDALIEAEQGRLESIFAKADNALGQFQVAASSSVRIATNVEKLLEANREAIRDSLEDVRLTMRHLRETEERIAPELVQASTRANDVLYRMQNTLERIEGLIARNEENVDTTLRQAREALESANRTSRDVEEIVTDVKAGKGTVGRLLRDEDLADQVEDTVVSANELMRNFRNPLKGTHLIYEMRWFEDDRPWSEGDNNLRHDLSLRVPFRDVYFVQVGGNDIGADNELELLFGYNWKRLTGRFGVIESEAALGADVELWPEQLSLSGEYVGITDDDEERFDSYLSVDLPYEFDLLLGVDDVFDEQLYNVGVRKTF